MDVKDSISVTLKTIDGKETKDQSAKNIFSYKPIMSNILKYTVEEYRDCSLEEIMNCIEGDTIQTGTALVEEDKKDFGVRPHKEKINISKEIINKTRGAVAPYAAQIFTHLSVVSSRQRPCGRRRCEK